jgi:hypothetical protein
VGFLDFKERLPSGLIPSSSAKVRGDFLIRGDVMLVKYAVLTVIGDKKKSKTEQKYFF